MRLQKSHPTQKNNTVIFTCANETIVRDQNSETIPKQPGLDHSLQKLIKTWTNVTWSIITPFFALSEMSVQLAVLK